VWSAYCFIVRKKGSDNAPRIDTSAGRKAETPEAIWEYERVGCMWAMIYGALYDMSFFC